MTDQTPTGHTLTDDERGRLTLAARSIPASQVLESVDAPTATTGAQS